MKKKDLLLGTCLPSNALIPKPKEDATVSAPSIVQKDDIIEFYTPPPPDYDVIVKYTHSGKSRAENLKAYYSKKKEQAPQSENEDQKQ